MNGWSINSKPLIWSSSYKATTQNLWTLVRKGMGFPKEMKTPHLAAKKI